MGLGKSLSVLALIAGTLDGFKGRPVSSTSSFDTSVQRAKLPTTLLVAPKSS